MASSNRPYPKDEQKAVVVVRSDATTRASTPQFSPQIDALMPEVKKVVYSQIDEAKKVEDIISDFGGFLKDLIDFIEEGLIAEKAEIIRRSKEGSTPLLDADELIELEAITDQSKIKEFLIKNLAIKCIFYLTQPSIIGQTGAKKVWHDLYGETSGLLSGHAPSKDTSSVIISYLVTKEHLLAFLKPAWHETMVRVLDGYALSMQRKNDFYIFCMQKNNKLPELLVQQIKNFQAMDSTIEQRHQELQKNGGGALIDAVIRQQWMQGYAMILHPKAMMIELQKTRGEGYDFCAALNGACFMLPGRMPKPSSSDLSTRPNLQHYAVLTSLTNGFQGTLTQARIPDLKGCYSWIRLGLSTGKYDFRNSEKYHCEAFERFTKAMTVKQVDTVTESKDIGRATASGSEEEKAKINTIIQQTANRRIGLPTIHPLLRRPGKVKILLIYSNQYNAWLDVHILGGKNSVNYSVKDNLSSHQYTLTPMSGDELKENVIEFKCESEGFAYRVIGLDGKEKRELIPWDQLHRFPKEDKAIATKQQWLKIQILNHASKAGHTPKEPVVIVHSGDFRVSSIPATGKQNYHQFCVIRLPETAEGCIESESPNYYMAVSAYGHNFIHNGGCVSLYELEVNAAKADELMAAVALIKSSPDDAVKSVQLLQEAYKGMRSTYALDSTNPFADNNSRSVIPLGIVYDRVTAEYCLAKLNQCIPFGFQAGTDAPALELINTDLNPLIASEDLQTHMRAVITSRKKHGFKAITCDIPALHQKLRDATIQVMRDGDDDKAQQERRQLYCQLEGIVPLAPIADTCSSAAVIKTLCRAAKTEPAMLFYSWLKICLEDQSRPDLVEHVMETLASFSELYRRNAIVSSSEGGTAIPPVLIPAAPAATAPSASAPKNAGQRYRFAMASAAAVPVDQASAAALAAKEGRAPTPRRFGGLK